LVPFSTHWPRCAVRGWDGYPWPASGRSRFDVLDSRRPAPQQVDQPNGSFALAVFRHRRSKAASLDLADDSGWFTLFVLDTSLLSLGCDCSVVITSLDRLHEHLQIQSSFDHSCRCFRGNRNRTLTRIRPSERNRLNPPPSRVMHRRVPSARCSATRTAPSRASWLLWSPSLQKLIRAWLGPSRPGRTIGPSLIVRRRSWGSDPSQVCSRIGWGHISAIPGPRAVRATPFHPINFRRADRARRVGYLIEPEKASGSGVLWRSTSGLRSRLRSAPAVIVAAGHVPALGFASCRVGGHVYSCIRPGSTPVRIIDPRQHPTRSASRLSAHGLGRPSPHFDASVSCHRIARRLRTADRRLSSPALQRLEGTDAWLLRTFVRTSSLFEVLHRP
jgi:hypothetical protein